MALKGILASYINKIKTVFNLLLINVVIISF